MTMQTENSYDVIISLIHEYTRTTTSPTIDGMTLWLLRRKIFDLQQQREVIRQNILQQADEFSKQKEMKKQ